MDGVLLKWTNYLSGWQPRYFILEDGILSYYQSKDDINTSCKASIKVSACDIIVHPSDHTRMDIIVPGEAHYYMKASTQQDRQLWLVALGTCKARSYDTTLTFSPSAPHRESECPTGEELLKVKRSELVMYRDILNQQLYNVKMTLKKGLQTNVESLDEATTLVNSTCQSFIGALEDCMQLVDLNLYMRSKESSLSPNIKSKASSSWGSQPMIKHVDRKINRSSSERKDHSIQQSFMQSISLPCPTSDPVSPNNHLPSGCCQQRCLGPLSSPHIQTELVPSTTNFDSKCSSIATSDHLGACCVANGNSEKEKQKVDSEVMPEQRLPNFFSQIATSFVDIKVTHEMEIPTVQFLDACRNFISVFDKLDEPAFIIGKLDVAGNIRKIHQKYISSPETFPTIQKILAAEMRKKESDDINSATIAILWLCKSLEFAHDFILGLLKHECSAKQDLNASEMRQMAGEVYDRVLKDHHSWVIRSAFHMILPSIPSMDQLICSLAAQANHTNDANFRKSLRSDAGDYLLGLRSVLDILLIFFKTNGLRIKEDVY